MLILVGKSKLLTWDMSGLKYLDDAINLIEETDFTSLEAQEILVESCRFRIWRIWQVDIKCKMILSHLLLMALDKAFEVSTNHLKEASPPKSISTELAVNSKYDFSVMTVFLSKTPIPTFLSSMQYVLSQLAEFHVHTVQYILTVLYYIGKFGIIPILVFSVICWPCLACGCIMCISILLLCFFIYAPITG